MKYRYASLMCVLVMNEQETFHKCEDPFIKVMFLKSFIDGAKSSILESHSYHLLTIKFSTRFWRIL